MAFNLASSLRLPYKKAWANLFEAETLDAKRGQNL